VVAGLRAEPAVGTGEGAAVGQPPFDGSGVHIGEAEEVAPVEHDLAATDGLVGVSGDGLGIGQVPAVFGEPIGERLTGGDGLGRADAGPFLGDPLEDVAEHPLGGRLILREGFDDGVPVRVGVPGVPRLGRYQTLRPVLGEEGENDLPAAPPVADRRTALVRHRDRTGGEGAGASGQEDRGHGRLRGACLGLG